MNIDTTDGTYGATYADQLLDPDHEHAFSAVGLQMQARNFADLADRQFADSIVTMTGGGI